MNDTPTAGQLSAARRDYTGTAADLEAILEEWDVHIVDEVDDNPERNPHVGFVPAEGTSLVDALERWRDAAVQSAITDLGLKDEYGVLRYRENVRLPTAEQILYILNDCEPLDLEALEFCVITGGSRRDVNGTKLPDDAPSDYRGFELGELLILNEFGREPFGDHRNPSKWSVTTFETKDYDAALTLSGLIKSGLADQDGLYEWSDGLWVRPDDQSAARQAQRDRSTLIARIGDQT